ncbi:FAS1 domain-containing protein [Xylariales sp. PMI_506]|nr:FAS1 domain-containing protein [Xylariales sp. PMI_506]
MKLSLLSLGGLAGAVYATVVDRQLLDYAPIPTNVYTAPVPSGLVTLLDLVQSRPELSNLTALLKDVSGFTEAFNTPTNWKYTFFAPSNTAFEATGQYFQTFAATPKGKWWLGNLLQHHYVPNTALQSSAFNATYSRFQTGSFLYVGARVDGDELKLNDASIVTEANIVVTNGLIHIIDRFLDPSAQIFESDLPKVSQSFIAGSCSNTALPYC